MGLVYSATSSLFAFSARIKASVNREIASFFCEVISVFYSPTKEVKTLRDCKVDPFFCVCLLTRSGR